MKVELELYNADEVNIIGYALLQVQQRRDVENAKHRATWQAQADGYTSEPITTVPAPEVKTAEPPAEEAKDALLALADKKGMGAAVALLEKFGAKRVGEVAPERRAEFIVAALEGAA